MMIEFDSNLATAHKLLCLIMLLLAVCREMRRRTKIINEAGMAVTSFPRMLIFQL